MGVKRIRLLDFLAHLFSLQAAFALTVLLVSIGGLLQGVRWILFRDFLRKGV